MAHAAETLSQMILSPVATHLNKRRIIVIADGALNYIPFQMLPLPSSNSEPLVAQHEIINAPSASVLGELREEVASRGARAKALAAFGNPAFGPSQQSDQIPSARTQSSEHLRYALRDIELNGDSFDPSAIGQLFYAEREINNDIMGRSNQPASPPIRTSAMVSMAIATASVGAGMLIASGLGQLGDDDLAEATSTPADPGIVTPGVSGIILTGVIVLATGALAANFFGRKLLAVGDSLLQRVPVVRSIYGGVKQISDTLFSPEGKAFRRAVLVRYPHAGAWTVALVTGSPEHEVAGILGRDQIAVFVPTTPNITAGFFLIVPRSETIELDMTVDAALKYIISMGVAEPARRENKSPMRIVSPSP
jgi:uncharacterized membrane protein